VLVVMVRPGWSAAAAGFLLKSGRFGAAAFVGPWLGRRLRCRSSGDGRKAKRPDLLPVRPR